MNYLKKFFRDESGSAEAASSAVMIGMASGLSGIWNSGLSGIWNGLINDPTAMVLVLSTLVFVLWVAFRA